MPWALQAKKLVLVSATSLFIIGASREIPKVRVLNRVSCICYPVQFRKDKGKDILALLDSRSKRNAMTPDYVAHLGLKVRMTNVGAQKIDGSSIATYDIVIAALQIVDKLGCSWFFQEIFLLADISLKVVLGMPFLTFSNADVQFAKKKLTWRTYTTEEALPTICQIEIIDWKKVAKTALDENVEAFVVHVSSLRPKMTIYPAREAQFALLLAEEVTVPTNYSDFNDVFSEKSANVLLERTRANEHTIKLEESKQPLYRPIYSQAPVELETLKTYIKTNLSNGFIRALKWLSDALIPFVRKPNGSLHLYVNYQELNNLTIKNWYPLPLIGKSLDLLSRAKQFTQLDLMSTYHWMKIK